MNDMEWLEVQDLKDEIERLRGKYHDGCALYGAALGLACEQLDRQHATSLWTHFLDQASKNLGITADG